MLRIELESDWSSTFPQPTTVKHYLYCFCCKINISVTRFSKGCGTCVQWMCFPSTSLCEHHPSAWTISVQHYPNIFVLAQNICELVALLFLHCITNETAKKTFQQCLWVKYVAYVVFRFFYFVHEKIMGHSHHQIKISMAPNLQWQWNIFKMVYIHVYIHKTSVQIKLVIFELETILKHFYLDNLL